MAIVRLWSAFLFMSQISSGKNTFTIDRCSQKLYLANLLNANSIMQNNILGFVWVLFTTGAGGPV